MNTFDKNKVFRGTYGHVWFNGDEFANIKSFECKVTADYEEMDINGDLGKHQRYTGYSIAGTITLWKYDSTVITAMADGIKSGDMPDFSIVASISDPTAYGSERIQLDEVTFDEMTLLKFEQKTVGEEEVPFKAASYEILESV